jgi:hypothetical protein
MQRIAVRADLCLGLTTMSGTEPGRRTLLGDPDS